MTPMEKLKIVAAALGLCAPELVNFCLALELCSMRYSIFFFLNINAGNDFLQFIGADFQLGNFLIGELVEDLAADAMAI